MEKAKYKRRDVNNDKGRYKVQNAKCKMQNAKYKMKLVITTANVNVISFFICLPSFLYLLSLFL